MDLPEHGYTPNNYKALVQSTGLTNAQFCREFEIAEQTFYNHLRGSRTMKWQDWEALLDKVKTKPSL